MTRTTEIKLHYQAAWNALGVRCLFVKGPVEELPKDFAVFRFDLRDSKSLFVYATSGMSQSDDSFPVELHIYSPIESDLIVEILYAIAHYSRSSSFVGLGDTVNFGRSWLENSQCDHGLVSLPYLDGPALEDGIAGSDRIKFYWLIPITPSELSFKKVEGIDSLEEKFDLKGLDYADPDRNSVI